ncbi:MAG TPA: M20/M25/M40 family metallo-hydrolase [Candidatus Sulfomarinibacteraceae bacterium]|nr:M20/M25/M40 family metallo-hydrolase [Candidatus Sulfomarinibacteraceae bacterium]
MDRVQKLARRQDVQEVLDGYRDACAEIVDLAVAIQQIPAPTFDEEARAGFIETQFVERGLQDVQQDELHNVYGRFRGAGEQEPLFVTAHTDTVFSKETDHAVRRHGGQVHGAGIADNSMGVAALLTLVESIRDLGLRFSRDIWFVANVGEEGLGDLRGMRAVLDRFGDRGHYIVLEGGLYGYVCHQAIGVRRYRIAVDGPGGHSWGAFGTPSATHALGRLITAIDDLEVPESPKTTYNVGVVEGGTTINAIAQAAQLQLDLRSEDGRALNTLVSQVRKLVRQANEQADISVCMTLIGDRPAGQISRDTPLVQWAVSALEEMGCTEMEFTVGSTDANIPLSRGLPAVCIGITQSGNTHRPDEYMETEPIPLGVGQALLLTLAAAGVET